MQAANNAQIACIVDALWFDWPFDGNFDGSPIIRRCRRGLSTTVGPITNERLFEQQNQRDAYLRGVAEAFGKSSPRIETLEEWERRHGLLPEKGTRPF